MAIIGGGLFNSDLNAFKSRIEKGGGHDVYYSTFLQGKGNPQDFRWIKKI